MRSAIATSSPTSSRNRKEHHRGRSRPRRIRPTWFQIQVSRSPPAPLRGPPPLQTALKKRSRAVVHRQPLRKGPKVKNAPAPRANLPQPLQRVGSCPARAPGAQSRRRSRRRCPQRHPREPAIGPALPHAPPHPRKRPQGLEGSPSLRKGGRVLCQFPRGGTGRLPSGSRPGRPNTAAAGLPPGPPGKVGGGRDPAPAEG